MKSCLQQCFQAYIHYSREQQLLSPQGACSVHMERRGNPQHIFFLLLPPMEGMLKWREIFSDCISIHLLNTGSCIFMMYHWNARKSSWKVNPVDFEGCLCVWYVMQERKESTLCCETAANCTPVLWSSGVCSVI